MRFNIFSVITNMSQNIIFYTLLKQCSNKFNNEYLLLHFKNKKKAILIKLLSFYCIQILIGDTISSAENPLNPILTGVV